jgi:hypothetical protein
MKDQEDWEKREHELGEPRRLANEQEITKKEEEKERKEMSG